MGVPLRASTASRWPAALAVALLAFAASATSLGNQFTYDDRYVIYYNAHVHTLEAWWRLFGQPYWPAHINGGLYRPLTMLAFTVEWVAGHGAPWMFHATNVALYGAVSVLVFLLADELLPRRAAWLAAALFAVHPVHVEAVGNIVGQSELLVAAFMLAAVLLYLTARRRGPLSPVVGLALCVLYVLGCFAKEHGVLLLPLLVAAELFVVDDRRALRVRAREGAPLFASLVAIAVAYVLLRNGIPGVRSGEQHTAVLGRLPWTSRAYVLLEVVREWGRLLLWPAHLSADYSPQQIMIPLRFTWILVPGLCVLLGCVVLGLLVARRNRVAAFGLTWAAVTLSIISGIFLPTGVMLAERTLFTPSVGVMLSVGVGIAWCGRHLAAAPLVARRVAPVVPAALLLAGLWRSADRQHIWHDNDTLWLNNVQDAPYSFRTHWARANQLIKQGRFTHGEHEYRLAVKLYAVDAELLDNFGSLYMINGMCKPALPLLRQSVTVAPERVETHVRLINCLLVDSQYDAAFREATEVITSGSADRRFQLLRQLADSARRGFSILPSASNGRRTG